MGDDWEDRDDLDDWYDDEPCDHDDYEVDILTGRAACHRCGETWWLSSERLKQELSFFCAAAEQMQAEQQE